VADQEEEEKKNERKNEQEGSETKKGKTKEGDIQGRKRRFHFLPVVILLNFCAVSFT
jgi:hypothetical protein